MKKYILLVIALVSVAMMSCSSEESKIDAKKDAVDLAKSIVDIIHKTEVKDSVALNSLYLKVDSIENTFYEFYNEYKKDDNGSTLLDSLKFYYNQGGKAKVDSAITAKWAKLDSAGMKCANPVMATPEPITQETKQPVQEK